MPQSMQKVLRQIVLLKIISGDLVHFICTHTRLNGFKRQLLGLSDVIVDIVETGATLQENGLAVLTGFMPISARVIANKSSYQFKRRQTDRLLEGLRGAIARRAHNKEEAR